MLQTYPSLHSLFWAFFRLGLTAFGGPSMVAYIRRLVVERRCWLNSKDFNEGAAFCQMVPGATAMQTAAWVGLRLRGVRGAAAAYLGFGLPAFSLMLAFAMLYQQMGSLPAVVAAFSGLQAVVVAIVANAAYSFGRNILKGSVRQVWANLFIAGLAAGLFWWGVNPLVVIGLSGGLGWLILRPAAASTPAQPAAGPGQAGGLNEARKVAITFASRPFIALLVTGCLALAALAWLAPELLNLALLMMKVDLMAFGGGFASVPVMYHEVVEVNGWLTGPTFLNGIVLGQVTPGPIVITATFIGYQLSGLVGALVATLAVFSPSFLIVVGLAPFFNRLAGSALFRRVIGGVLASFVGLLFSTMLRFAWQVPWDLVRGLLALLALLALLRKVDILWVVLSGILLSILLIR